MPPPPAAQPGQPGPPRIEQHALIGDCRSAALVDGRGAIDWLCWPRFDSAPVFAALLDPERGGFFRIAPAAPARSSLHYIDDTNVAVTRFALDGAMVELIDAMTIDADGPHDRTLLPEHEVVRVVVCQEGEVKLKVEIDPRPGFGAATPKLTVDRHGSVRFEDRGALYTLRISGARSEWRARPSSGLEATVVLRAGEHLTASLVFARDMPSILSPVEDGVIEAMARTIDVWRAWAARARYDGAYRDAVVRSALALKLLCYSPSGAIIAAPTTSLPEKRGGQYNWDYRFCWLRDAAFTTRALYGLGYDAEGDAFVDWLLHATRLTAPALRVLYDVFGEQPPSERVVHDVAGFRGAYPVRVGNAAADQLQLDVHGEVVDAIAQAALRRGCLDTAAQHLLLRFADYVVDHWRDPDQGIWEVRHAGRNHVHSYVLAWVALDRIIELANHGVLDLEPKARQRVATTRDVIAREVRLHGWSPALGAYVATLGGNTIDASVLLLGWYGFEDPASERMRSTAAAVDRRLGIGRSLVRRNLELPDDGGFVATSFWAVDNIARGGGSVEQARERFEELLRFAPPTGLFAEIIDPLAREHLGNYPQGFSHLALINAALSIADRERRER